MYTVSFAIADLGRSLTASDCRKSDTLNAGMLEQVTDDLIIWHGIKSQDLNRVLSYIGFEFGRMIIGVEREFRGGSVCKLVCGVEVGLEKHQAAWSLNQERESNMFEWIKNLMAATGCDWETAAREYDYYHNPNYNSEDYDCL